jgi:hypothetical protein
MKVSIGFEAGVSAPGPDDSGRLGPMLMKHTARHLATVKRRSAGSMTARDGWCVPRTSALLLELPTDVKQES